MDRLSQRAFDLLKAEIDRLATDDPVGKVQREIALKRLQRLRSQPGQPASLEELRDIVEDLFPTFSAKVLATAARANNPSAPWHGVKIGVAAIAGIVGGIWFLNLPYPPIRWAVARSAPLVLLPSFFSMDHNYRGAIATTEQADQLVNNATSAADFDLGKIKVQAAQKHLDALPVWFLGYYPQAYCSLMGCTWRFTFDEFEQARKDVARMDAKLFQETNAQKQLEQADQIVSTAKQTYQEASTDAERQPAIGQWQQGIDTLQQVPRETLAGKMAQTRLVAYERDFQQVAGYAAGSARTGSLIQAAKVFANKAQQASKAATQPVEAWEIAQKHWETAIDRLEKIAVEHPEYNQAQALLADYKDESAKTELRLMQEKSSIAAYEEAEQLINRLLSVKEPMTQNELAVQLQEIEQQLSKVSPGTTVYAKAQKLGQQAAAKRNQVK